MMRFHSQFHENVGMNLLNLGMKNKSSFPLILAIFFENLGGIFEALQENGKSFDEPCEFEEAGA